MLRGSSAHSRCVCRPKTLSHVDIFSKHWRFLRLVEKDEKEEENEEQEQDRRMDHVTLWSN